MAEGISLSLKACERIKNINICLTQLSQHIHCQPSECVMFMSLHDTHHFSCTDRVQHPCSHPAVAPSPAWALVRLERAYVCEHVRCSFTPMTLTAGGWTPRCAPVLVGGSRGWWDCAWLAASRLMSVSSLTSAATASVAAFKPSWKQGQSPGVHSLHSFILSHNGAVLSYRASSIQNLDKRETLMYCFSWHKSWFCSWDINSNYSLNALDSLSVKTRLNFQV